MSSPSEDRHLDSRPEGRKPDDDEVVHVHVREAAEDPAAADRRLVQEIEVDPPQRRGCEEPGRSRRGRARAPAHPLDPEHNAKHGLAEDDQRQQAEAFRDVTRVDRGARDLPPGQ